jgi:NADH-quinone oxidoreductase subunit N
VANICLYISLNSLKISSEEITLNSLKGIFKDNPFVAISLTISLLSLAGAPLTAGFWGKFNVVILSYSNYGMLIPIFILLGALMSFYYYIKIIRNLFSSKQINAFQGIEISNINYLILTICIFLTILLGVNPGLILKIL